MTTWPPICPCSLCCALIDGLVVAVHRPMIHRGIAMSFAAGPRTVGSTVLDNPYVKATPGAAARRVVSRSLMKMLFIGNVYYLTQYFGPWFTDNLQTGRNCKSALYAFHNRRQLITYVRARCIYISPITCVRARCIHISPIPK